MQNSHSTTSSSFRQSYVERDLIEKDRFEDDRRRRHGMAIVMVPLGIAMALIVHYTNIVVAIDDADWQYVLHRPDLVNVMKLSIAPFIGGGVAMLIAGMIATQIAGREGRFLPFLITIFIYTIFMPISVGLLLPANLLLLDVLGQSVVDVTVGEAVSAWIWGTPFFVLTYTLTGIKQAFWAGLGSVLLTSAVFWFSGPNRQVFSVARTTVVTSGIGAAVVALIFVGPLSVFELLFNWFRAA
jgi:hypothetical protein